MRIACVDETAAGRVAVARMFDRHFEQCRAVIGHIRAAVTYPASKEEALVNAAPDAFAVGPEYSTDKAYAACRDLNAVHPTVPIFVFFKPDDYSLRTLKRFERITSDLFSTDESPVRIVHRLECLDRCRQKTTAGKLVMITGVKGGVGATSIVSGLAHAATAVNRSAVVVDLSPRGVFAAYLSLPRRHSTDLGAAFRESLSPDRELVERSLIAAANGITMLLPPAGGTEVRELWLRNPWTFEHSLSLIETLREMFDLVLVDVAGVEGVLEFGLNCRADVRLLVTSNDPAAVHLLGWALAAQANIPGEGSTQILINRTLAGGLTRDDILDYLWNNEHFEENMALLSAIPFDSRGGEWIGTGNSFYTEGSPTLQQILEEAVLLFALDGSQQWRPRGLRRPVLAGLRRLNGGAIGCATGSTAWSRLMQRAIPFTRAKKSEQGALVCLPGGSSADPSEQASDPLSESGDAPYALSPAKNVLREILGGSRSGEPDAAPEEGAFSLGVSSLPEVYYEPPRRNVS